MTVNVKLYLQQAPDGGTYTGDGAKPLPDGYIVSSDPHYSYQFRGGNRKNSSGNDLDNGDLEFKTNGAQKIDINIKSTGYEIANVEFKKSDGTAAPRFVKNDSKSTNTSWEFNDTDPGPGSGTFNTTVSHGTVTGINCDPTWQNDI